jgi:hypothetical protein
VRVVGLKLLNHVALLGERDKLLGLCAALSRCMAALTDKPALWLLETDTSVSWRDAAGATMVLKCRLREVLHRIQSYIGAKRPSASATRRQPRLLDDLEFRVPHELLRTLPV